MVIAKDFIGNTISIGDEVIFMQKGYRNLINGRITKLTDKMCFIEHERTNTGGTETRQYHDQVIKIIKEED